MHLHASTIVATGRELRHKVARDYGCRIASTALGNRTGLVKDHQDAPALVMQTRKGLDSILGPRHRADPQLRVGASLYKRAASP